MHNYYDELEKKFDYEQFLIIAQKQTMTVDYHLDQILLQQFQCQIIYHNNRIQEICIDEECNQLNRRVCIECINQRLHSQENIEYNLKNVNQINNIIYEFNNFIKLKIDQLLFSFYYEQLNLAYENNDKIAGLKYYHLNMIDVQLSLLINKLEQIDVKQYIEQQNQTNIGLYQYLYEYYDQLQKFYCKIQDVDYLNLPYNYKNCTQEIISKRKQKHLILSKILKTQTFINGYFQQDQKSKIHSCKENMLEIGKKLCSQQQYELAIEHQNIYLSQNPNNYQAYNLKGTCFYNQQKYEEAMEMYEIAINLNPNDHLGYYSKGSTLASLEKHKQAIEFFDIAIKLNPNNQDAYNNKGFSLEKIGKSEEAIKLYDIGIQLNPRMYEAYNNKALSLSNLQKYEQALEMYDKAIQLNPSHYISFFNKGFCFRKLNEYEKAIQMYDLSIKFNPKFSKAYNNKGYALRLLSRNLEAIEMYDLALNLQPQYRLAMINKGDSLRLLQMHDKAIQMYDMALNINPKDYLTLFYKGTSLDSIQQYQQAIQTYDQSIKLNPKYHLAYSNKGYILQALQKFDEAQQMFDLSNKILQEQQ